MHVAPAPECSQTASSVRNRLGLAAGLLAGAAALSAHAAHPTVTVYVDKTAPHGGDGSSWQSAYRDLQNAFDALQSKVAGILPPPAYVVKVAQGTYKPDHGTKDRQAKYAATIGATSAISISLLGSFGGLASASPDQQDFISTRTIVSGDLNDDDLPGFVNTTDNSELLLVVDSYGASITIDSFDFRGGNNTAISVFGYPSGVFPMSAVTLTDAHRSQPISVTRCNFENNQSLRRGGALLPTGSLLTISECTFHGNRTEAAGGAFWTAFYPSVQVIKSVFVGNVSGAQGGAISFVDGTVDRCVFDSNVSGYQGGGFSARNWSVSSSLFVRNHAAVKGGAFAGVESMVGSARHCTLADNQAGTGAAFAHDGTAVSVSDIIAWGNVSTSGTAIDLSACTGLSTFGASNLQGGAASVTSKPGKVTFSPSSMAADPQFIQPASGPDDLLPLKQLNYRLRWSSPAIGASISTESAPIPIDLDGNQFPALGSAADLGCYFNNVATCLFDLSRTPPSVVNDLDFELFAVAYDTMLISERANPSADFNRDGVINDADFQLFVGAYDLGMCP